MKVGRKSQPRKQKQQNNRQTRPVIVEKEERSIGSQIGSFIGDAAQKLFKTVTGFGDYEVTSNSLIKPNDAGNSPPLFNPGSGRSVIVKHREFLQDVLGSTAYSNQVVLPINPGVATSFPWLSSVASQFEQYRIRGMVYEYKTTSATALVAGTNTAMGAVMMATQYNANNSPFADKVHLENYDFATSCVPSISMLHPIECAPNQTSIEQLYVRTPSTIIGNQDLRLYDMGLFQLSTVGFQNSNIIGELWVTYEIELYKPKLGTSASLLINEKVIINGSVDASPLGTSLTLCTGNSPAVTPSGVQSTPPYRISGTQINLGVLPIGIYLGRISWQGGSTTTVMPGTISVSGAPGVPNIFSNSTVSALSFGVGAASNFMCREFAFTVAALTLGGNILTVSGDGTLPTGGPNCDLIIEGIPFST